MAAMTANARDVEHLWTLTRLLINEKHTEQAVICLELCTAAAPTAEVTLQANILLAECLLALCASDRKERDRELWWKRYKRAERCVFTADSEFDGSSAVWGARLRKCKYLLVRFSKSDTAIKNRQLLESLCDGIRWCCERVDASPDFDDASGLQAYFLAELRGALVRMHSESMLLQPSSQNALAAFEDNLKIVRTSMPSAVDPSFQLWLIEVSCHVLVTSPRFSSASEATNALAFADRWISSQQFVPPSLKLYHLIIQSFSMLRSGEIKKLAPLVDELKSLRTETASSDALAQEPFLENIVDALELEVLSRSDPCQALALSMKAIHQIQANLPKYTTRTEVYLLLVGLLFDMLFSHCDLHCQQSRYFEMGVSIAQLLTLFGAYKQHLESTSMSSYYVARVHVLIVKYSFAIGRMREGEAHVQVVVQRHLPALQPDDDAYPLCFVRLWVDLLDATTYCSGVSDPAFVPSLQAHQPNGLIVRQICSLAGQLNLASQILAIENLRDTVHNCGNVELRSRFDLALCKWMWATQELSSGSQAPSLRQQPSLEQLRPDMLHLLHESLQLISTHVNCNEGTAEIMALFGPKLIEAGRPDDGEDTLKSAIRLSLVAKNMLLQTRLLVDIFRLYSYRQLTQAQATTAEKYEKKIAQLQRRISQAQSDQATTSAIFSWRPRAQQ